MRLLLRRALEGVQVVLIGLLVLGILGFGIGSSLSMPRNARVFIDPDKATYLAPPCLQFSNEQEAELARGMASGTSSRDSMAVVVRVTGLLPAVAEEAYAQKLRPDPDCRDDAGFMMEGRSLTGSLLERIGILPKQRSRWNADGSWNW